MNVCLFDCNIDADVFYTSLIQQLLPAIAPNSVIVLDNAVFHKRSDALLAVQKQGHVLEFSPPYSPDLNPIEKNGYKPKALEENLDIHLKSFLFMPICDTLS